MSFISNTDALFFDYPQASTQTPTYNFGNAGSNNFASGIFSALSGLGVNNNTAGNIAAYAGEMTTPQFQSALGNQESELKGRQAAYQALSIANQQFSQGGVPLSFDPVTGKETGGASLSMVGRWATIGIGAILLIGGLYLFGSSSISDAISGAVSSIKGNA